MTSPEITDALAQEIRRVDGNNSLGAGALAEALMPFLSAALAAGAPGVKALEWRWNNIEERWEAETAVGRYSAWGVNGAGAYFAAPGQPVGRRFATLEAAKAAAQADYEARVLSALEPAPSALVAEPGEPVALRIDTTVSPGTKQALADIDRAVRQGAANAGTVLVGAAPPARQDGALREALDLDAAVSAAACTWCWEKDRETFQSDVDYFKCNWRALGGLTAYVDREIGKRVRAALAQSAAPVQPEGK